MKTADMQSILRSHGVSLKRCEYARCGSRGLMTGHRWEAVRMADGYVLVFSHSPASVWSYLKEVHPHLCKPEGSKELRVPSVASPSPS